MENRYVWFVEKNKEGKRKKENGFLILRNTWTGEKEF